jgi:hypothetical protein
MKKLALILALAVVFVLAVGPRAVYHAVRDYLTHEKDKNEASRHHARTMPVKPWSSDTEKDGLYDTGIAVAKGPNTTRILFVGDSLNVQNGRGLLMGKGHKMPEQMCRYLTAIADLEGKSRKFEALMWAQGGPSYQGSPLSKLLALGHIIEKYKVDVVIPQVNADELEQEREYQYRGASKDGSGDLDPEIKMDPPSYAHTFGLLERVSVMVSKAASFSESHGVKLVVVFSPAKVNFPANEQEGGGILGTPDSGHASTLERVCKSMGVAFINPQTEMLKLDPEVFPLFSYGDQHFLEAGHRWEAFILAQSFYFIGDKKQ